MHQMIELHPKPDALRGLGLPAIPYPVGLPVFQAAVSNDGELPLADMLHGLQLRAAAPGCRWQPLVPAMTRLAELLAGDDARTTAGGDGWWLDLGPVDLRGPVVTLRRDGVLVAVVSGRSDGRLRVGTWQPLDARSADLLMASGAGTPAGDADGSGQAIGAECWERLRTAAAAPCAGEDGLVLAFKPEGLVIAPGDDVSGPRPAAHVAAELEVRRSLSAR